MAPDNKRFYVYAHTRNDTGEVFYIGKGTYKNRHANDERYQLRHGRSDRWRKVVQKAGGFEYHILGEFDNEDESFWAERQMIRYHGRRDLGTGTLVNMTDGGEGLVNIGQETKEKMRSAAKTRPRRPCSESTKEKISSALTGQKMSYSARENMRRSSAAAKQVICVLDLTTWPSAREFSQAANVDRQNVYATFQDRPKPVINRWGIRRADLVARYEADKAARLQALSL